MAEGEGVVGGVLFEQEGEVEVGVGRAAGEGEEGGGEGGGQSRGERGRRRCVVRSVGAGWVTVKVSASSASSLSQPAMRRMSAGRAGEDVVLLPGGEGEEEEDGGGPEAEEEAGLLEWGERGGRYRGSR